MLLPLLSFFALFAWLANRNICPRCGVEDIQLELSDGTAIRARLYLPPQVQSPELPAVVVSHGYLANLGFMEIPWAADLTHLGIVALFLDRRGHGWSEGQWWSRPPTGDYDRGRTDLAEAVAHLRTQVPVVDPERIGIIGHSDGGTAAIVEASLDWNIRTTIALSASAAPWELVNHVVPQDLLLLYGTEDGFVLHDTDVMLISNATRGYLEGPGIYGHLDDGSARRLIEVPGAGHVTLLYSAAARREALQWLRRSLHARGRISLSGLRLEWSWAGALVLLLLAGVGFRADPRTPLVEGEEHQDSRKDSVEVISSFLWPGLVIALWCGGLVLFPWFRRYATRVPSQQGWVGVALLGTECILLLVVGALVVRAKKGPIFPYLKHAMPDARRLIRSTLKGALGGMLLVAALQLLLYHRYSPALTVSRWALFCVFLAAALPAFLFLEAWLTWTVHANAVIVKVLIGGLLATATALVGGAYMERMEILPLYIVAATICFYTAYRCRSNDSIAHAVFGAFVVGRALSVVCPFY